MHFDSFRFMLVFILVGLLFPLSSIAKENLSSNQNFLSIADIHFDPFISCTKKPCPLIQDLRQQPISQWSALFSRLDDSPIQYKKDSNYALIASSLDAAKKEDSQAKVKFVLVIGDFLGHDYDAKYRRYSGDKSQEGYSLFVKKTMEFLAQEMNQRFPHTDIYWVVGNNDSYGHDYQLEPQGQFFKDWTEFTAPLIKNSANREQMQSQFPKGGYYAVNSPSQPGLRLVFLNSVLFSRQAKGPDVDEAAKEQLTWLHEELLHARQHHQQVLIAMHIPTGIDVYTTLFIPFRVFQFWKEPYTEQFLTEIQQASPEIMGIFTAHIHADAFQIMTVPNQKSIAFTGTPSISPIFGNNPGFKIYTYSLPSLHLVDFSTYYDDLQNTNQWQKEYDFDEIYQLNHSDGELITGMNQLQPKGELAEHYKVYYSLKTNSQPITKYDKWLPYYWCAIWSLTLSNYRSCLNSSPH